MRFAALNERLDWRIAVDLGRPDIGAAGDPIGRNQRVQHVDLRLG